MLLEYFTIHNDNAEPGKGLLHSSQYYDDIKKALSFLRKSIPIKRLQLTNIK